MSDESIKHSRRDFLRKSLVGIAAVPFAGALFHQKLASAAESLPKLDPSSQTAKNFDYTNDATSSKNAKYKKGEFCHNCQLYTGDRKADHGTCAVFPGHVVNTKGWCTAYTPMAS